MGFVARVLREEQAFLERECQAEPLLDFMLAQGAFSPDHLQEVRAATTRTEQNQKFFEILRSRGPRAFPVFLQALRGHGQDHVAARLEQRQSSRVTGSNQLQISDMYLGSENSARKQGEQDYGHVAKNGGTTEPASIVQGEKVVRQLKEELRRAQVSARETKLKLLKTLKDNKRKQQEIDALKKDLNEAKQKIRQLEVTLRQKEKENAELRAQVERQGEDLENQTRQIEELKLTSLSPAELAQVKALLAVGKNEPQPRRGTTPLKREDTKVKPTIGNADKPHPMAHSAGKGGHLKEFTRKGKRQDK